MAEESPSRPGTEGAGREGVAAGAIAFMLTDVEGSTRLWERDPASMALAMARHDAVIAEVAAAHGGEVVRARGEGDSSFNVFRSPSDAVAAAVALQQALAAEPWPESTPIRVRLAVHVGEAQHREGDYYGSAVNRCARLRGLAYGGQAVISAATRALVDHGLDDGTWFLDLGQHRLKDLAEPEHIYQVCHPDLPREFPALRGIEALPNNLPIQLTSFIGRDKELRALADMVRTERLVTLSGAGGCGKTRLALEVAAAATDRFDEGVWFVDLSSVTDPGLVPDAVAGAIGLRERAGFGFADDAGLSTGMTEAVISELVDKRVLLVLDNCEHLVEAAATLVRELLVATPLVTVLATSRELLGVPGETVWHISPLATPDPLRRPALEVVAGYDAVRLFCERARKQDARFDLTEANVAAVAEICVRVDGIPLAVELAAARTRHFTASEIAARLKHEFSILTSPVRGARSRQATLRAAVDWSHELLDPAEKRLFRRLAIFNGGWTLDAACQVCGGGEDGADVIDILGRLVDKSMVVREVDGGDNRFRLLEPLRQYALERLVASAEADAYHSRHLEWYAAWAADIDARLLGAGQAEALRLVDADLDNIRGALEWGVPNARVEALSLATSLRLYWQYRMLLSEGMSWLTGALDAPGASPELRVRAMTAAGRLATGLSQFATARTLHRDALVLAEAEGKVALAAAATWRLAQVATHEGEYGSATELFSQAIALAREAGDRYLLSVALIDCAKCTFDAGDDAPGIIEEGLALARQAGDVRNQSVATRILGEIQAAAGNPEALTTLADAVELGRTVQSRDIVVDALLELGRAHVRLGQVAVARVALAEALAMSMEADYPWGIAASTEVVADLLSREGHARPAHALLAGAAALRDRIGEHPSPRQGTWIAETRSRVLAQVGERDLVADGDRGQGLDTRSLFESAWSQLAAAEVV